MVMFRPVTIVEISVDTLAFNNFSNQSSDIFYML